jgi:hypothetical protein
MEILPLAGAILFIFLFMIGCFGMAKLLHWMFFRD